MDKEIDYFVGATGTITDHLPQPERQMHPAFSICAEDRALAGDAAEKLMGAFVWLSSPQGDGYWSTVYANLMKISRGETA